MLKRILTSVVSVCILLPVLFLSDTIIFPVALALVCCIALYEMYKCIGKVNDLLLCLPIYFFAALSPFILRYLFEQYLAICFVYAVLFLLYSFLLCVRSKGATKFGELGEFFTVTLYIIAAFNSILYLRDLPGGKYIYLLVFVGAWITDTFAYFSGVLFGKHKLIPEVSPKKTVEGSIGGTVFCMLAFVLFGFIVALLSEETVHVNYLFLTVGGLIAAIVSQIGDLIMSVIKRQYGVKDYGKIFPGHGGVLDRFDSILAVALILCAICVFSQATKIVLISGGI